VNLRGILLVLAPLAASAADYLVYAGTYTRGASKGIYAYRFESATGKLRPLGVAVEISSPSFLALHPNRRFLYAVGEESNTADAFAIDPKTGKLTFLNEVSSQGQGPCHLALDATGRWLAVANYGSGSMAILPVQASGRLGEAKVVERHGASHAHDVLFSPDNRFLLLADLGLDRIFVYRFDAATGSLAPNDPPYASVAPGAGVRHLAFHPNGRILYAISETASTVTAFRYDPAKGTLESLQTVSTLPPTYKGASTTAEIAVNQAGTALYGSNRGHDSLALFSIDPERFALTPMEYAPTLGKTPRHFALDPTGGYLLVADQDSNEIVVFRVHPKTGQLMPVGRPATDAPLPVCLLFVP
jgi:6-phosphogluconolactonase